METMDLQTEEVVRTVSDSQHEILKNIIKLHSPQGIDADITYGNGAFYKGITRPRFCSDISPQVTDTLQADCTSLPVRDSIWNSVVVDLPFLTYITDGRNHQSGSVSMSARFGGYYSYPELSSHYKATIDECYRVLRQGGKLILKCQDIVHNHRLHCTHANVIRWANETGFRLVDLFILTAKHRMPGPQSGQQRHARIWHSYFLVFEKLRAGANTVY